MKLWMWNWQDGGYNWCKAATRAEAIKIGNEMHADLKVDESTVREGTFQQLEQFNQLYASACH